MSESHAADRTLNKRQVLAGLRCHKLLWWLTHDAEAPELRHSPDALVRFAEGNVTDDHARRFLGDGVHVSPGRNFVPESAASATHAAMASGATRLFQPTFLSAGANIRADALERAGDRWTLVEVKSAKSPRDEKDRKKKVEEYRDDVAVQAAVVRGAGVDLAASHLLLLNRDCVHPHLDDLFVREDVTPEVDAAAPAVLPAVAEMRLALRGSLPEVEVGDHCVKPDECPFYHRCHDTLPEHHVSELYYAKRLAPTFEAAGKALISQLTEDDAPNPPAKRQVRAVRSGRRVVEPGLAAAVDGLARPIAFLDFETVQPAVPRWPGCRPNDFVAVQFSVHREGFPDDTSREYLAARGSDPRAPMLEPLIEACAGARTVLVYYEQFEKARLDELAEWFPAHRKALLDVKARIVDLLPIVRDHVYDPAFRGSFSLKKVLPALVPGLDYSDLRIQEGATASAELYRLLLGPELDAAATGALRADLLAYCRRDTEAMVRLLDTLRVIAR